METWIETRPAYHKVPKYGVHGLEFRFFLRGEKGVIDFVLSTNWMLPETYRWWSETGRAVRHRNQFGEYEDCPLPMELGFHSYEPMSEDDEIDSVSCRYLNDEPCYYGYSLTRAEKPFQVLVREGLEGLWKYLEEYYCEVFDGKGEDS